MGNTTILDKVESGGPARLISVTGARQKGTAAVSALLAVFRIVPEYAKVMLADAGVPISTRSKLRFWSEVCFKKPKYTWATLPRPECLLIIDTSRRGWAALIEGKIKGEEVTTESKGLQKQPRASRRTLRSAFSE